MKDSYGRTIDYLRISLTDRCNLRCIYCMPAQGVDQVPHSRILRFDDIEKLVRVAAGLGVKRIRLTGGEPLVRKGVVDMVRMIAQTPGIEDVSMTTNGILLAAMAHDLKQAGLSRVNISLDTLDAEQYRQVTRGGDILSVEEGIAAALREGFDPVKVNAVAVRSLNQDFFRFASLSVDRPLHVRFIEYMPVGDSSGSCGCGWGVDDVISCDEILQAINRQAQTEGVGPLTIVEDTKRPCGGGPARYYAFPGAQGTVGFISPLSNHFCGQCNRMRLTAEGMLRPCLFSDNEIDAFDALKNGSDEDVRNVLLQALAAKPNEHHEGDHANATHTNMNEIGG